MKHYLAAITMAVVLISCAREELLQSEPSVEQFTEDSGNYVLGEARVFLSEDMAAIVEEAAEKGAVQTKSPGLNLALEELGIIEMSRLFPHAGEYEERTRREGLHRWYVVKYDPNVSLTKSETSLTQVEGVEIFEPVQQIKINDFNDLTTDLWGLYNQNYKGVDINVKPVWDYYTTGSKDVIVAVVDNGIDLNHEDLSANCLPDGRHYNYVDNNSYIIAGEHGTHVAGTIGAVGNNGKGVVGVAGGDKAKGKPGVMLMSSQIFRTTSSGKTDSAGGAAAIKSSADNGAVIAQNSWGYNYDSNGDGAVTGDELTMAQKTKIQPSDKSAVDYFIKYAGCDNAGNQKPDSPMKGGVVIFAAGNDNIAYGAPGSYEEVIAVGSIAQDGTKSSFSNYGDWVDICAPGSGILSTVPNNGYAKLNGTSMACPHVSGVAALLVSYFGGPGFTNEMLKEKLLATSNKSIVSPAYKIGGLVDAYAAFAYGNDLPPANITDLEVSGRGNNIDLTFTVPADEDGKAAYGLLAIYGTDKSKVEAATVSDLSDVNTKALLIEEPAGSKTTCTISELDFTTGYFVKVAPYSYGRNYADLTEVFSVSTTENHAPVVNSLYEGEYKLFPYESLNIPIQVVEPDGHSFQVEIVKGSDAETLTGTPDGNWRLTLKGSAADVGTYTSKIIATDQYGLSSALEIEYVIKENTAPEIISQIEDVFFKSKGQEILIDMSKYVYDEDGEQLRYEISVSNAKVVFVNSDKNNLIITSMGYGTSDVEVVAKDARGESVTLTFNVTVKDPSDPLSLYPNPVKDYLNVATLDLVDTEIVIANSTGKVMFHETMKVSAQEPARIDMTSYAPGTYSVQVKFGGKEYKKNVVKL